MAPPPSEPPGRLDAPQSLAGLRVLDLSRMVAGGVAGMVLADFGADVVKVEQPGSGDPLRQWTVGGEPFWWRVYGRNKRLVTLNLKTAEGRELLLRLVPRFGVMMESFVPGTLERLGLGWDVLRACNPSLILVRISGWGQTGPRSDRPGLGTLVEATSGFAAMNGEADGPPIVPAFPLADVTAGLYATSALMFALHHQKAHGGGGQVVDVSLFESLFSLLGPLPAEYAALGLQRTREGSRSRNAGPRGCYRTVDGGWIAVSGSTPAMAERILRAWGLDHVLADVRFATNEARVQHAAALDDLVRQAIGARTLDENVAIIERERLTAAPVQTVADVERDPHWQERELLVDVPGPRTPVRMHNACPRLSDTPGVLRHAGGVLGQDNQSVFAEIGVSGADLERLQQDGIV